MLERALKLRDVRLLKIKVLPNLVSKESIKKAGLKGVLDVASNFDAGVFAEDLALHDVMGLVRSPMTWRSRSRSSVRSARGDARRPHGGVRLLSRGRQLYTSLWQRHPPATTS
jgi:hypothetical protein